MIEFKNITNELVLETKRIPQNCGDIAEKINIDNYNSDYQYFLELECAKDKRYISKKIVFNGQIGEGEVILPDTITATIGKVNAQLIIRNNQGTIVGKSFVSKEPLYNVEASINATMELDNRTGDYIEFVSRTAEDIKNLSIELENKVNSGFFNGEKGDKGEMGEQGPKGDAGKDGTIIKLNNQPVAVVEFKNNPQQQLDGLETKHLENKKNIERINVDKCEIDLIFKGNVKEFTIDNFNEYQLFIFNCSFDFNKARVSIIADRLGKYYMIAGRARKGLNVIYGACLERIGNRFSLNTAGFFNNNYEWQERLDDPDYGEYYEIIEIFGVKIKGEK